MALPISRRTDLFVFRRRPQAVLIHRQLLPKCGLSFGGFRVRSPDPKLSSSRWAILADTTAPPKADPITDNNKRNRIRTTNIGTRKGRL